MEGSIITQIMPIVDMMIGMGAGMAAGPFMTKDKALENKEEGQQDAERNSQKQKRRKPDRRTSAWKLTHCVSDYIPKMQNIARCIHYQGYLVL